MSNKWIRVGDEFINLDNVTTVRVNADETLTVVFIRGGDEAALRVFRGDAAKRLLDVLTEMALGDTK